MWHTPQGDRTLSGAEAKLLKSGLTHMVERLKEESSGHAGQCNYDIGLFDQQTWSQRLAVLEQVATHLFTPTPTTLPLTAVNEAAIGALFQQLRLDILEEIEAPYGSHVYTRELTLQAYHECLQAEQCRLEDTYDLPASAAAEDFLVWSDLIEFLTDQILWDRDYEMEDLFMDVDPVKAREFGAYLGIDTDYFSAAPPDIVTGDDAHHVYQRLSHLRIAEDDA